MGLGCQINSFARAVTAGASNNRDPPVHAFDDITNYPAVLLLIERCGFAGGSHSNDTVSTVIQMKVHQFVQMLPVNVTVWMHGRDQCDKATRNHKSSVRIKRIW